MSKDPRLPPPDPSQGRATGAGGDDRGRTLRLIDFLEAYDARRNPPVHDIADYGLYRLDASDVGQDALAEAANAGFIAAALGDQRGWVRVTFVDLPHPPEIPDVVRRGLAGDVTSATLSATEAPQLRPSASEHEATAPMETASAAERTASSAWIDDVWQPWSTRYRAASAAKQMYRELFEVRQRLETDRDSVELVFGLGMFRWDPEPQISIRYPFATVPAEVEVDPTTQQLVVTVNGTPSIENLHLAGIVLADASGFHSARAAFDEFGNIETLIDDDQATELCRRLIRHIDDSATFGDEPSTPGAAYGELTWTLFLRRRRPDYQGFLEAMRDLYRAGAAIPDPLRSLITDRPSELADDTEEVDGGETQSADLLLPLPTNEEQQRIVRLAQRRAGVTVQGPPGTGKSHTIANIVSHYVADGRRVLVVAEKEQALRVLADKIPGGISDLCVSVLGADTESRRSLEASITNIQTRVAALDKRLADRMIEQRRNELDDIDRRVGSTLKQLTASRRSETETIHGSWLAGTEVTPAAAAKWVADHADVASFDPEGEQRPVVADRLSTSTQCPLSAAEISEMAGVLARIGGNGITAVLQHLPDPNELPTAATLAARWAEADSIDTALADVSDAIRSWDAVDANADQLDRHATELAAERRWLTEISDTWLDRVRLSAAADVLAASDWRAFTTAMRSDREQIYAARSESSAHSIRLPEILPDDVMEARLRDGLRRFETTGKLGLFARDLKRFLDTCIVDGHGAGSAADIKICLIELRTRTLRRQLRTRWEKQTGIVGAPPLEGREPELALGAELDAIDRALTWTERYERLRGELSDYLTNVSADPADADLRALSITVETLRRRERRRELEVLSAELHGALTAGAAVVAASPLWEQLVTAHADRRSETWAAVIKQVGDLRSKRPEAERCVGLQAQLNEAAPLWVQRIVADPVHALGPSGALTDELLEVLWQWRQLDVWVSQVTSASDPAKLQRELAELATQRSRCITELVTEQAWRRLADNLTDRHRQALNSYVAAVKRYGKTGGKYAARWLAEIRTALNDSKDAVPVWIMPTTRALTSFRPEANVPFDVLIVDEASQIGIDAVPLLSLARMTIVVGDDKQTSPDNVGLNRQTVFDLLDEYVAAVPKYRTLFDPENSLYDMAFQKFPDVVMLTEHFRCLPDIIAFSNRHAYDQRIIPLRDRPPRPGWQSVAALQVSDGYRIGDVNPPEADAAVELVGKMLTDPDYDGMDFGVVSLLGTSQSKLIWDKLFDVFGPDVLAERHIRCGEPANFQGDERDVMLLSTVVAPDPSNPSGRFGAMTDQRGMRRINVAASRARNQMWVIHTPDAADFAVGDLRGELIRHCANPGRAPAEVADLESRCESEFERRVLRRILDRGFERVHVQYPVGRYRIDIVIEGDDSRLAVEADGDRWHGDEVWHQDRARQEVLERAGWTFERVRGSSFFRDPERALEPLWERLNQLGIAPTRV